MWANIYSSSVIVVNHMVVKLKREADSLEVDIQTFVIILVTVSKNVFTVYFDLLNVGQLLFKFSDCCKHIWQLYSNSKLTLLN